MSPHCRRASRAILLLAFLCGLLLSVPSRAHAAAKPNVIVILADDLGWRDLRVLGATDLQTPNLDALATNGVRCTNGYVTAPICSPSRAALLTGRYQQRFGHETNPGTTLEHNPVFGLPLTESTMGNRMKDLGYATGWIGKSHLGGVTNLYHPLLRGFDEFFGFIESHHNYFETNNYALPSQRLTNQEDPILRGWVAISETNYLTYAFARECTNFIARHAGEPFFLYAPFNATHFPLQATTNLLARFSTNTFGNNLNRFTNAAMLAGLDDAVGAIVAQLQALNIETNTLIFVTRDNGGATNFGSINSPLRGTKTDLYEGGVRVPFLMHWPGHLPTNKVFSAPVSTLDILPTAIAAAGGTVPAAWRLDGVNLLPFVRDEVSGMPHTNLFWRVETDGVNPPNDDDVKDGVRAMRQGDWKFVKPGIEQTWELYDLANDPGESINVAARHPDVLQRMLVDYADWNAQLARPNYARNKEDFSTPEFVLEDVPIGATNVSYLAPEFLPGGAQVAFQDGFNQLWRAQLDPLTGRFLSAAGQDLLVDAGLTPLTNPANGPEWGRSTNGPALFYNRTTASGRRQIWRARLNGNTVTTNQLTASATDETFGVRAGQEGTNASVKILFDLGNNAVSAKSWADENSPGTILALPRHAGGPQDGRWLPNGVDIAYAGIPLLQVTQQIMRYSTATQTAKFLTDEPGNKTDVAGFLAPEFGGELCYAAVVDRDAIAIYRDLQDNTNGFLRRVATLTLPTNTTQRFIYSMEPLHGLRGFNGISYFSCVAYQNDDPQNPGDAAMWLFGLGPDTNNIIARRVDEGSYADTPGERRDPKTFVGEREVFFYYTLLDGTKPAQLRLAKTGLVLPDHQGPPSGFTDLKLTGDFSSGETNLAGQVVGGTETMVLATHKGVIFAGTSSRMNQPYPTNAPLRDDWIGAQILLKDAPNSSWRVDPAMPPIFRIHLGVEALVDFTFTTKADGSVLTNPPNFLVAGLSDISTNGANIASARTRIDAFSGEWEHSTVATSTVPANLISIGSHVDRMTNGVHRIFAGLENGEIYRGAYDVNATGRIVWASGSVELTNMGPVTGFAEANGFLYAAAGLRQANSNAPVNGGLFVRIDTNATWKPVYQWPQPPQVFAARAEDRVLRGLTAVPDPFGEDHQVLLAARNWAGVIERIDPAKGHAATIELDVRDFFARLWHDVRVRRSPVSVAYTGFTPVVDPVTGRTVHLVGVWIEQPDTNAPSFGGSHFLVRHGDGTYEAAGFGSYSRLSSTDQSLRGMRAIAVSPFPADGGNVLYLGGYDAGSTVSTNTAWIARGDWDAWPGLTLTRPNPPAVQLAWPITQGSWLLEASESVDPLAPWSPVPGLATRGLTDQLHSHTPATNTFYRLRKN